MIWVRKGWRLWRYFEATDRSCDTVQIRHCAGAEWRASRWEYRCFYMNPGEWRFLRYGGESIQDELHAKRLAEELLRSYL